MNTQLLEQTELAELDKIRQQFNHAPYPRTPLEDTPKDDLNALYIHNLVTSYYLKYRKVIQTEGKVILDAGCGSGYKSLMLAEANPGARIVGIDLSETSVELARQRLNHYGFENTEFHAMSISDVSELGLSFDYINCDEVLYLLPDPVAGLQAMKSVLKPEGLIRTNLHNAYQRAVFYRAQTLFKFMGLMDSSPKEAEQEALIETMRSLKPNVKLKTDTWRAEYEDIEKQASVHFSNHLLLGDKGYTIPDMFAFLEEADLELVNMVNWRHWDVVDLFQEPDDLPMLWGMSLAGASVQEKLRLYELLNPIHRLMDFWCTPSGQADGTSVEDWTDQQWRSATVHLHPQLRHEQVREELLQCIESGRAFELSQRIPLPTSSLVMLGTSMAACLLPLWQSPMPMMALVERYCKIEPVNLVTLEPRNEAMAFERVKSLLQQLEAFLYVLLEQPD
jgi:2-polyprenyl-3-methyl-5-hydroxy-6-metoxy-1,4-benzoquinol methylase